MLDTLWISNSNIGLIPFKKGAIAIENHSATKHQNSRPSIYKTRYRYAKLFYNQVLGRMPFSTGQNILHNIILIIYSISNIYSSIVNCQ